MKMILLKEFTSGSLKGVSFNDQIKIKTEADLMWVDRKGQEIEAFGGSNYVVVNAAIYDENTDNYLTKEQARWKLKGY